MFVPGFALAILGVTRHLTCDATGCSWTIRAGDDRVTYEIHDHVLLIVVVAAATDATSATGSAASLLGNLQPSAQRSARGR